MKHEKMKWEKGVEKYLYRNWSIDSDVPPLSIKKQMPYYIHGGIAIGNIN